jgi:hypothetical protein
LIEIKAPEKFYRRHIVDIPRIKFFGQRRYRANWSFVDGHEPTKSRFAMTHEDAGHYAGKHPEASIDASIAAAIEAKQSDGRISCAAAHAIAAKQGCDPRMVGINIDLLEKRISHCQMGLFGHGSKKGKAVAKADAVSAELEAAIRDAMDGNRLTCKAAWDLAERLGLKKMDVACACEALEVKVGQCQLGAF